jgi:hypothetical protein
MKRFAALAAVLAVIGAVGVLHAGPSDERPTVANMPPVVIKTLPVAGDTEVNVSKTKEVRVTFSKPMMAGSWSWTHISDETALPVSGEVHFDKSRRTCIAPVELKPGKTYVVWLNRERYQNFMDENRRPAVPYLLVFETKQEEKGE